MARPKTPKKHASRDELIRTIDQLRSIAKDHEMHRRALDERVQKLTVDLMNARVEAADRAQVYAKLQDAKDDIQHRDDLQSMKVGFVTDVELAALTTLVQQSGKNLESKPWNALCEILMARGVLPSHRYKSTPTSTVKPTPEVPPLTKYGDGPLSAAEWSMRAHAG